MSVLIGMLEQLLLDVVEEHKVNATNAAPGTPSPTSADAQAPQVPGVPSAHRPDPSGSSGSHEAADTAAGTDGGSRVAAGGPGGVPSPGEDPDDKRTRRLIEAAHAAMLVMPEGQQKAAVYAAASLLAQLSWTSSGGYRAAAIDYLWHTFAFGTWPLTWLSERRAGVLAEAMVAANPALAVLAPQVTATAATPHAAAGAASAEEVTQMAVSAVGFQHPVVVRAGKGPRAAAAAAKAAAALAALRAGAPGGSGFASGGGGSSGKAKKGKDVAGQVAAGGLRSYDRGDREEDFEDVGGTQMGREDMEHFEQLVLFEDDLRRHQAVGGVWWKMQEAQAGWTNRSLPAALAPFCMY